MNQIIILGLNILISVLFTILTRFFANELWFQGMDLIVVSFISLLLSILIYKISSKRDLIKTKLISDINLNIAFSMLIYFSIMLNGSSDSLIYTRSIGLILQTITLLTALILMFYEVFFLKPKDKKLILIKNTLMNIVIFLLFLIAPSILNIFM